MGLLFREAKRGRTSADIARIHETSEAIAKFRLNASGVLIQIGRIRDKRRQEELSERDGEFRRLDIDRTLGLTTSRSRAELPLNTKCGGGIR
jgi:hypothetical protein